MSATAPTSVDALPTAPDPADRTTFNTRAYTWSAALPTFRTQLNNLGTNVYANAVDAAASATTATTQAGLATSNGAAQVALATTQANNAAASAAAAVSTANAAAWVNGGTYALNDNAISGIDFQTYRKKTASSVTTIDPKNDSTNWVFVGSPPTVVLLAVITPTAAANVDFLSTFTSAYDQYLIVGEGLNNGSGTDTIQMRVANSGTVDSASNYFEATWANQTTSTAVATVQVSNNTINTGKGANFEIRIGNVNDSSGTKTMFCISGSQSTAAPAFISRSGICFYQGGAVSGLRLYWAGGSNFAAQGKIRVYGIANS